MSEAYDPASQADSLVVLQRALDELDQHFPGDTDAPASTARGEIQRLRESLLKKRP
jgi:hypothetical protein